MVGSLYRSKNIFHRPLLYLYKSQIPPTMEYCCHIWAVADSVGFGDGDGERIQMDSWIFTFWYSVPSSNKSATAKLNAIVKEFAGLRFWLFPHFNAIGDAYRVGDTYLFWYQALAFMCSFLQSVHGVAHHLATSPMVSCSIRFSVMVAFS